MSISIDALEKAAARPLPQTMTKSVNEATAARKKIAFLSHSHLDQKLARGLQVLLAEQGWDVFIDWEHNMLDGRPTKETATWLQHAIVKCDWLLYLATQNSAKSRWCPWEIGYADGKKSNASIVVVSTKDSGGTYGSEYLDLYRRIIDANGKLIIAEPGIAAARYLSEASTTPSGKL
jgi:hypothetical protein